jgi:hypothetical protein
LHELVAQQERGDVLKRNSSYGDTKSGPFDPAASPLKITHHVSTPYGKNDIDSIRKTCQHGGKFTANRDTIRKAKEEPTVVVPNEDRINPEAIGSIIKGNENFLERLNSCLQGNKTDTVSTTSNATTEATAVIGNQTNNKDAIKAKLNGLFGGGGTMTKQKPLSSRNIPTSKLSFLEEIKAKKANKAAAKENSAPQTSTQSKLSFLEEITAKKAVTTNDENITPTKHLQPVKAANSTTCRAFALADRTNTPQAKKSNTSSFLEELTKRRACIE